MPNYSLDLSLSEDLPTWMDFVDVTTSIGRNKGEVVQTIFPNSTGNLTIAFSAPDDDHAMTIIAAIHRHPFSDLDTPISHYRARD